MPLDFKMLETAPEGAALPLGDVLDALPYNDQGLVAAIAVDAGSGQALMLAWMDRAAIERTLATGDVWYFSRSRQRHWRKGETSGHEQRLAELRFDCDGDALLLKVRQTGPACHTGRRSCFYLRADGDQVRVEEALPGKRPGTMRA